MMSGKRKRVLRDLRVEAARKRCVGGVTVAELARAKNDARVAKDELRRARTELRELREKTQFPSQVVAQIPPILLGTNVDWIVPAIPAYIAKSASSGTVLTAAEVVRTALDEMLANNARRLKTVQSGRLAKGEVTSRLGPFRLPEQYKHLPDAIEKVAKRDGVSNSDVVRAALVKWFTAKGFGEGTKKGKG